MIDEDKVIFSLRDNAVSPRFIASADIHLGKKLYNIQELEDDMKENFVRLCNIALAKQVEYLVICGDLFEDNVPTAHTVSFVREQVERLWDEDIRLIGIAGDHDKPIQGESWCNVSGLYPITICPNFTGFDYYNTASGMELVMQMLLDKRDLQAVQWIFLHCQFPQLFQFTEEKKRIDFTEIKIFDAFPNLQGIIAGDIHEAQDAEIVEKEKIAYMGYCGSTGVNDMSESVHDHSAIYCDGHHLRRINIPMKRSYVTINFRGEDVNMFNPTLIAAQHKNDQNRPIFSVAYDSDSEQFLSHIKPLYTIGYVRPHQVVKNTKTGLEESVVSIRSEMKTSEKIEAALKESCEGDKEAYGLLSDILSSPDAKLVLDDFKRKADL